MSGLSLITNNSLTTLLGVALAISGVNVQAQSVPGGGVYAYPSRGQSIEQQKKDQFQCHQWAAGLTGFDPIRNRPPSSQAYAGGYYYSSSGSGFGSGEVGQGGMAADGARGAAMGAIGGAIAGDAGKGAAIGAAAGALFGGMKRSSRQAEEERWQQQQQAQAQQQYQRARQQYYFALENFERAYGSCMSARKYKVQ